MNKLIYFTISLHNGENKFRGMVLCALLIESDQSMFHYNPSINTIKYLLLSGQNFKIQYKYLCIIYQYFDLVYNSLSVNKLLFYVNYHFGIHRIVGN